MGFAVFGGGDAGVAPVIGVDFFDDDVGQVRALVEHAFEGFGELGDDLGFLLRGHAVTGDAQADEGHGDGSNGRASG